VVGPGGTGARARRELGRSDLSGKTGTSNDRRDAWFGGFNADLAAIVWVGYDDDLPLGPREEGSRTALPIWVEFARIALKGSPEHKLPMPERITSVKIDRSTGCRARSGQLNITFEIFRVGHEPNCDEFNEVIDVFNDAAGIDPEPEDEKDDTESLF
jgi:penicillin-binding protein 1A